MSSHTWKRSSSFAILTLACLGAGAQKKATVVAPQQSIASVGNDWSTYNGDTSGRRYSSLTQINSSNVKNITMAWAMPTKGLAIKGTPLVIDGVMYFTTPNHAWV